nr:hypothetical protein [Tanacetum cinerariifolium]
MTVCLNDLSYIPSNNEHNEPTQGDIGNTSNKPTQAIRNEFEELYASANEELYPGCDYVTRLDFMAKFTHFKVKEALEGGPFPLVDTVGYSVRSPRIKESDMIHQRYIDKDPSVNESVELFASACGPSLSPISINSCIVIGVRNNITQILARGESFKDDQYILATKVKQVFYLEDMARRPPDWKVVQDVNHKKVLNGGVIMVEDDHDLIHFDNLSDLALSTSLDDLDFATLNIDGQLMDMSTDVARGHSGNGGGDDRPSPGQIPTGCRGNLKIQQGRQESWQTRYPRANQEPQSNLLREIVKEFPMYYHSWHNIEPEQKVGVIENIMEEMLRLMDLGPNMPSSVPYTDDEIMAIIRRASNGDTFLVLEGFWRDREGKSSLYPSLDARTLTMSMRAGYDEPGEDEDADEDEDVKKDEDS